MQVLFINRKTYQYKNTWEQLAYNIRVIIQKYLVYPACKIIAFILRPLWEKPYFFYEDLKRKHFRYNHRIEPLKRYIHCNPDSVIISFMVQCYNTVFLAVGNNKKNRIIFSERDDPAFVTNKSTIKLRNQALRMADACVFQTVNAMNFFPEEIKLKSHIIPNPISEGLPMPYVGPRRKVIVNFSRLHKKKNLPLLIDAFKLLSQDFSDYALHLYGDGELLDELANYIREQKLENRITIFNYRSDIYNIVKDYAMFVLSSDYEGISNSMLEAMALGLPVVCTDYPSGGARMFIKPYYNGILTPVGDVEELYKAMKYLIENPEKAAWMGLNASTIREELSLEKIAAKWIKVIESID